jgi:glucosylceramidase
LCLRHTALLRARLALVAALTFSAAVDATAPARAATAGEPVAGYLTTADLSKTLARQPDLRFAPSGGTPSGADAVAVDPASRGQTLTAGFGVAMTETSAYELDTQLPPALRDHAMELLFSPAKGIGLSFLRVPIGGTDYIVGPPYTYDDVAPGGSDPALAHFSVARDQAHVFPMIHRALVLNPAMTVMANPWSPPAWMKADDKLVSVGPDGTLLPQYYPVYAFYLVRSVQSLRAAGVPVHYLGVQNEPYTPLLLVSGIPNSYLSGPDEGNLIANHVTPALRAAGLAPKILAYDDGFQRSETFIPAVMALAASDVGGFAYHCYLSDATSMSIEHQAYPQQPAFETECSSHLSNIEPAQMTIRSLRNEASGVQLWNAALDQSGGPKIGNGCAGLPGTGPHAGQQCIAPVTVNSKSHTYSLTSDFWALAHFSRFIKLGAQRVGSTTPADCHDSPAPPSPCGVEDVVFRNPDGSEVLVATANDGRSHTMSVSEGGQTFSATVPDGATATFVWPATKAPVALNTHTAPPLGPCTSRRTVRFRLPRGARRVRLRVDGRGRKPTVRRGVLRLSLYGLPRRRVTVQITARVRGKRYVRRAAVYPCVH